MVGVLDDRFDGRAPYGRRSKTPTVRIDGRSDGRLASGQLVWPLLYSRIQSSEQERYSSYPQTDTWFFTRESTAFSAS